MESILWGARLPQWVGPDSYPGAAMSQNPQPVEVPEQLAEGLSRIFGVSPGSPGRTAQIVVQWRELLTALAEASAELPDLPKPPVHKVVSAKLRDDREVLKEIREIRKNSARMMKRIDKNLAVASRRLAS